MGGVPGGHSTGDFNKLGNAVIPQYTCGDRGTVAAAAEDGNGTFEREFGEAGLKVVEGDVEAAHDVAGGPFGRSADVEQ